VFDISDRIGKHGSPIFRLQYIVKMDLKEKEWGHASDTFGPPCEFSNKILGSVKDETIIY